MQAEGEVPPLGMVDLQKWWFERAADPTASIRVLFANRIIFPLPDGVPCPYLTRLYGHPNLSPDGLHALLNETARGVTRLELAYLEALVANPAVPLWWLEDMRWPLRLKKADLALLCSATIIAEAWFDGLWDAFASTTYAMDLMETLATVYAGPRANALMRQWEFEVIAVGMAVSNKMAHRKPMSASHVRALIEEIRQRKPITLPRSVVAIANTTLPFIEAAPDPFAAEHEPTIEALVGGVRTKVPWEKYGVWCEPLRSLGPFEVSAAGWGWRTR